MNSRNLSNLTAVVLIPLILLVSATPAHAIFGSILAGIQRAQMIVNQGVQIYEAQIAKLTMDGQLTELTSQFEHLKDQALGSVGAISEPFTRLASQPTALISTGIAWKNDFTGEARQLADAVEDMGATGRSFRQAWRGQLRQADQVSEQDIVGLFTRHPPGLAARAVENFHNARERSDKRLVLDHAISDAAAELTNAVRSAVDSYDTLRNNRNTSNTALQQAAVAGQVTQGQLTVALSQMMAYQAAREAAEDYEREIERRRALAERVEAQRRAQVNFAAQQAGLDARRGAMRESQLIRVHPFYGGSAQ